MNFRINESGKSNVVLVEMCYCLLVRQILMVRVNAIMAALTTTNYTNNISVTLVANNVEWTSQ